MQSFHLFNATKLSNVPTSILQGDCGGVETNRAGVKYGVNRECVGPQARCLRNEWSKCLWLHT